jgi:hypothetical protein
MAARCALPRHGRLHQPPASCSLRLRAASSSPPRGVSLPPLVPRATAPPTTALACFRPRLLMGQRRLLVAKCRPPSVKRRPRPPMRRRQPLLMPGQLHRRRWRRELEARWQLGLMIPSHLQRSVSCTPCTACNLAGAAAIRVTARLRATCGQPAPRSQTWPIPVGVASATLRIRCSRGPSLLEPGRWKTTPTTRTPPTRMMWLALLAMAPNCRGCRPVRPCALRRHPSSHTVLFCWRLHKKILPRRAAASCPADP